MRTVLYLLLFILFGVSSVAQGQPTFEESRVILINDIRASNYPDGVKDAAIMSVEDGWGNKWVECYQALLTSKESENPRDRDAWASLKNIPPRPFMSADEYDAHRLSQIPDTKTYAEDLRLVRAGYLKYDYELDKRKHQMSEAFRVEDYNRIMDTYREWVRWESLNPASNNLAHKSRVERSVNAAIAYENTPAHLRPRGRNEFRARELRSPAAREMFADQIQAEEDMISPPSREELEIRKLRKQVQADREQLQKHQMIEASNAAFAAFQARVRSDSPGQFDVMNGVVKIGTMTQSHAGRGVYTDARGVQHHGSLLPMGDQQVFRPDSGGGEIRLTPVP